MTVDLRNGANAAIEADPEIWARFGYSPSKEKIKRKKAT